MTGLGGLEELLARSIGLDPASLGASSLRRAVERRRRALGLEGERPEAYLRRVRASPEELQELVEELVVPETWFFRDGQPFVALRRHAAAWLGPSPARRGTFRVLSVPCASGEEPYSIAITLLDLGLPRDRFVIDALDISARALEIACRGVYRPHSLRGIDPTVRDRHFRPHPDGTELDPEVRRCVQFARGNLLEAGALRGRPSYDVIFCRNLLIYFDAVARRRAVEVLDRLLATNGLLFVGHSERLPLLETRFTPHPAPGCFCYGKDPPPGASSRVLGGHLDGRPVAEGLVGPVSSLRSSLSAGPAESPPPQPSPSSRKEEMAKPIPARGEVQESNRSLVGGKGEQTPSLPVGEGWGEGERTGASIGPADTDSRTANGSMESGRPAGHPDSDAAPRPAQAGGFDLLAEAADLANRREYDRAAALCEEVVRRRGPSAEVYHLLGAIRLAAGDLDDAERWLTRAVYLDAQHEDALLALALIAGRRGDGAAAARFRRRAERVRKRKADA